MATIVKRRIILGVTGSIAAIKTPELVRELIRQDFDVLPAMTPAANQFTTEYALSVLAHNRCISDIFPDRSSAPGTLSTWHIELARSVSAMVIAPCSATTIGKLAHGIYDNAVLLFASALPRTTPLFIAPGMDEEMWLQPAVQNNIEQLKCWGAQILGPESGDLASGLTGLGRMMEPKDIVHNVIQSLSQSASSSASDSFLQGKRVLITGGPTFEPIDPVRFIGNRSSGKMGAALARGAALRGAEVTLIMGPSSVQTNGAFNRIDVETSEEMLNQVERYAEHSDIIIMNAAISDFAPVSISSTKIKKSQQINGHLALELRPTVDILSVLGKRKKSGQVLIGFALETGENAENYARAKLREKNIDMIVLNRADEAAAGFGTDTNKITIFNKSGATRETGVLSKDDCASEIFLAIQSLLNTQA